MKFLFSFLTISLMSTVFFLSCSEDSGTNSENNPDVIMPLKVGNLATVVN